MKTYMVILRCKKNGEKGFVRTEVTFNKDISNKDIDEIEKKVRCDNGFENAIVVNFQRLRKE